MAKTQKTVMEGLSVVLSTGKGADRTQLTLPSHGRKVRLDEAIASIVARPHFTRESEIKGIGVFDAAFLSDVEAVATHVATLPGGRAEVARFGLERKPKPFQVQVYERRKVAAYAPASDKVRSDHLFIQRELIETARNIAPVAERLECTCGTSPATTDTRCAKCGRRFDEPLVARALPPAASCIAAVKACAELGLQVPKSGRTNDATCFWPANAAQSLGATAALAHLKYRLLEPGELQRRMTMLREVSGWPAAYPIVDANELHDWLWALDSARVAPVLEDLEVLAKRHAALLKELSADLLEPGWNAAAHAMSPVRGELPWNLERVRNGLVRLSSLASPPKRTPPARATMLDALRLARLHPAKGRALAVRVAAGDRSWLGQGELLLALQHLDGVDLFEAMRGLLEQSHPVVEAMVRAWCFEGVVPAVASLDKSTLVAALEKLRSHLPATPAKGGRRMS